MQTIVLSLLAMAAGLVLLEVGAERFTEALGGLARRLHASEGVVGLLTAAVQGDGTIEPRQRWLLIGVFAAYVVSILLVIQRGWLRPPEEEDDDTAAASNLPCLLLVLALGFTVVAAAPSWQ